MNKYIIYSFIIISSLILIYFLNTALDNYAETHYNNNLKILDHGHKFTPNLYEFEYILTLYDQTILLPLFFNIKALIEFIFLFIIILLIRSFVIWLTVLPKYKKCNIKYSNIFFGGCYDKLFSGHTAGILIATLLYKKYFNLSNIHLVLINAINIFLLLSTRGHYTNDIIMAIFVSLLVYNNNSINNFINNNPYICLK